MSLVWLVLSLILHDSERLIKKILEQKQQQQQHHEKKVAEQSMWRPTCNYKLNIVRGNTFIVQSRPMETATIRMSTFLSCIGAAEKASKTICLHLAQERGERDFFVLVVCFVTLFEIPPDVTDLITFEMEIGQG